MTDAQIDFVLEVQRRYDLVFPLNGKFEDEMFVAAANDRDIEVARISAYMLIEMYQEGENVATYATEWVRLFEALYFPGQSARVN